jgi:hypothetical protein
MEVRDGFIVGVFNYCDRWCERCPLASRCRVFADRAEDEFERDHGALGEPRQERMAREMGAAMERWEKELGIDLEAIQREAEEELKNSPDPDTLFVVPLEHLELETRARDFAAALWKWMEPITDDQYRAHQPLQVLGHFGIFVAGKIYRALMGLKDGNDDDRSDALGSAKVALLGLEEMRAACGALAATGVLPKAKKDDFVERLEWLMATLDSTLPRARAFVRPGLDEPEEVTRLEVEEGRSESRQS